MVTHRSNVYKFLITLDINRTNGKNAKPGSIPRPETLLPPRLAVMDMTAVVVGVVRPRNTTYIFPRRPYVVGWFGYVDNW